MKFLLFIFSFTFFSCNSSQDENKYRQTKMTNKSITEAVIIDTISRPFKVVFKDINKIQIGSPYNTCKIELLGINKIQLPQASWQDKLAWSNDSKRLILVKWNTDSKINAFTFFIINTETGITQESIGMVGAINHLKVVGDTISYNKFYYNKAMTKDTLCCIVEEDYIIKRNNNEFSHLPTNDIVSFITVVDTANLSKDGIYMEGYIVDIGYEEAKKLNSNRIRVSGIVTIVNAVNNKAGEDIKQGRERDSKHILNPKIEILK
jgi:hypothetical protein